MFNTIELHNKLIEIKNNSSSNRKIELLTEYVKKLNSNDFETLLKICTLVFDYNITFNIAKIPKFKIENTIDSFDINHHLTFTLPLLINRDVTGNNAKDLVKYSLESSENIETANLLKMIINKSFDIGADLATFRKALNHHIVDDHLVMLCSPGKPKILDKLKFPLYAQIKYDAMRIEHTLDGNALILKTRPGKIIKPNNTNIDNIVNNLLCNIKEAYQKHSINVTGSKFYLDGEMIFLDENGKELPRAESNGIANSCLQGTKTHIEQHEVVFYIWDIITEDEKNNTLNIPYETRFKIVKEVIANNPLYKIAKTVVVNSLDEAKKLAITVIKEGKEGLILKEFDGHWKGDRVKHQVKLKAARECELKVVSYNIAHDNKYDGLIGSLVCVSDDKKVLVNISGLSDKQRSEWLSNPIIDNIITVRFNELIKGENNDTYSLFLPRFVELRLDKTRADTLEEIQASQFVIEA